MLASNEQVSRSYVLCRGSKAHERMNPDSPESHQVRGKVSFETPHRPGGNIKVKAGAS
jgi:hypothetical protein